MTLLQQTRINEIDTDLAILKPRLLSRIGYREVEVAGANRVKYDMPALEKKINELESEKAMILNGGSGVNIVQGGYYNGGYYV